MSSYRFELWTDHFQFYLQDWHAQPDTSVIWNDQTIAQHIAVTEGLVAIGTLRYGGSTDVTVELCESQPEYSARDWDYIVHASIAVHSHTLMLYSPEMGHQGDAQIDVEPGMYEVLVFYGNIEGFDNENDLEGEDHYRLALWPGNPVETHIIKTYSPSAP
jgi:hypothetical protein